jgi:hypothetical protein
MNMYLVSREDKADTALFIIAPHLEAMKEDTSLEPSGSHPRRGKR